MSALNSKKINRRNITVPGFILAMSDLILINISFFLGFYLSAKYSNWSESDIQYRYLFFFNIFWLICGGIVKLYTVPVIYRFSLINKASFLGLGLYVFIILIFSLLVFHNNFPPNFFPSCCALTILAFSLSRFTFAWGIKPAFLRTFSL